MHMSCRCAVRAVCPQSGVVAKGSAVTSAAVKQPWLDQPVRPPIALAFEGCVKRPRWVTDEPGRPCVAVINITSQLPCSLPFG